MLVISLLIDHMGNTYYINKEKVNVYTGIKHYSILHNVLELIAIITVFLSSITILIDDQ